MIAFSGREGQLLLGSRVLAELEKWEKKGRQLSFQVKQLNAFLVGLEQPPDRVRLYLVTRIPKQGDPIGHWRVAWITDGSGWQHGKVAIGPTLQERKAQS